jgi:hypothetical protein
MTNLRPGELRVERMHDDEGILRIHLPRGIGFVEIHNNGVHGATGYPVIGVEVVSETLHSDAADGRRYSFQSTAHGAVLIGEPGPKMLEQERFMREMAKVIAAHDSGDHTGCPEACRARDTESMHEHRFAGESDDELCVGHWADCPLTWGQYKAGGR